jgi:hypothetical protein
MATRRTVTKHAKQGSNRTAADAHPVPHASPLSASESRYLGVQDADRVARWLNASNGTASHERIVRIRRELEDLRSEFMAHSFAYQHISNGVIRLGEALEHGRDWPETKLQVQRELHDRHVALNLALAKYVFRPRATYVIAGRGWIFGMVPDENRRSFQIHIGNETISEADAVLSLVRLAETGDLRKIRLCETCKEVWLFAAKRNYRFCSDQCREGFYARSPDYHSRKAANQQKYRERLKLSMATQEANWKGR